MIERKKIVGMIKIQKDITYSKSCNIYFHKDKETNEHVNTMKHKIKI